MRVSTTKRIDYRLLREKVRTLFFIVILGIAIFVFPALLYAKAKKLSFGTDMRFRTESQGNFNVKYYGPHPHRGGESNNFLLGRLRLGFDYRPHDSVHIALWGQDAREWGNNLHDKDFYNHTTGMVSSPYTDEFELWDTYFEVRRPDHFPFGVKVGRQQLSYGDKRIFGPGSWSNTGYWTWDAIKVSTYLPKGFIDIFYGRAMIHEPVRFSLNHRHFFESLGTYSHVILRNFGNIEIEPFAMTKRDIHRRYKGEDRRLGNLYAGYAGVRVYKKGAHGFDFDVTYVREFGSFADDTIQAYGYHLLAAYRYKACPWHPRVSVEYTVGSGDKNPRDGRHESFDGAFGPKGELYGRMCLVRWQNMRDAQINLELRPKKWKWFYIKAEFHRFRLDEKRDGWSLNPRLYRDKSGNSGDKIGSEFDLVGRFHLPKGNQIQAGYGHFWPGEFVKKVASGKQANWFFLQWRHKFNWKLL